MSAIGPGSWVVAVREWESRVSRLTIGAIYQVSRLVPARDPCVICGDTGPSAVRLVGQDPAWLERGGHCACFFAPWPPPADEALRCEPVDADEPVSVPA